MDISSKLEPFFFDLKGQEIFVVLCGPLRGEWGEGINP